MVEAYRITRKADHLVRNKYHQLEYDDQTTGIVTSLGNIWSLGSTCQANQESTNEDDDEHDDEDRTGEDDRNHEDTSGFIVRAMVDEQGALLVVPEVGVSMSVPEGAISRGRRHGLHLAVLGDDSLRPSLPPSLTLLSAVVACGPSGIDLVKPVILQFEHCAELRTGNWELSLWSTDFDLETRSNNSSNSSTSSNLTSSSMWRKILTLGGEPINLPGQPFAQLDHSGVFLVTETPSVYAVAGENSVVAPGLAVKRICVAVFLSRERDHIRCHLIEDTKAAFKLVIEQVNINIYFQFLDQISNIIVLFGLFLTSKYCLRLVIHCTGTSARWHSYRPRSLRFQSWEFTSSNRFGGQRKRIRGTARDTASSYLVFYKDQREKIIQDRENSRRSKA